MISTRSPVKSCPREGSNLEILDAVMAGGAGIIQLREKNWKKKAIHDLALEFRKRTYGQKILFIINDHVDIALAVDADGVHLGQEDLSIAAARRIAPGLIIGASSHNVKEALQAEKDGADYVNIGPIFPTSTKKSAAHFLGPGAIREIGPRLSVPYTTMGGINIGNIHQVLETGARSDSNDNRYHPVTRYRWPCAGTTQNNSVGNGGIEPEEDQPKTL